MRGHGGAVYLYRGLEAFTEQDAVWFHGRGATVDQVLAALDKPSVGGVAAGPVRGLLPWRRGTQPGRHRLGALDGFPLFEPVRCSTTWVRQLRDHGASSRTPNATSTAKNTHSTRKAP